MLGNVGGRFRVELSLSEDYNRIPERKGSPSRTDFNRGWTMGVDRSKRTLFSALASFGVFLLICFVCGSPFALVGFERTYGGSSVDHSHSIQQTQDGGYILSGCTDSYGAGLLDIYLVRTDSLGDTLWTRTFGGTNLDFGFCVQQTHDLGYIVAGLTYPDSGSGDVYLIRMDSLGDSLWTRRYGGDEYDVGISVQQTRDLGYVICGLTYSFGADSGDMYIVKTDSLGDTLWTRNHGGSQKDFGRAVQQTEDGGYVLGGYTGPFGGPYDMYLVKMDSLGGTLWTRTYGGINGEFGFSVQQTQEGGYVVAGNTYSFGAGEWDIYLVKTDSLGGPLWTKTYGGGDVEDREVHVQQTTDGGYIIAGNTASFGAGLRDLYLIKTDSLGETVWERTYGGSMDDYGLYVQQTQDGGYAVSGGTESFGAGSQDIYLVKTDGDGFVGTVIDAAVQSIESPPDTVLADSGYGVAAMVRNLGNAALTFDVVATIDAYQDTVQVQSLEPDSLVHVTFEDWQAPPTDSTTYGMTVCAYAVGDVDSTNDCMQKSIFAYNPPGIEEKVNRPLVSDLSVLQNTPNPFRKSTTIRYSVPLVGWISLEVYDVAGRLVETLVNETQQPGMHQVRWNRKDNPAGVYFYSLRAGGLTHVRKMIALH